jgi:hypothetical protein
MKIHFIMPFAAQRGLAQDEHDESVCKPWIFLVPATGFEPVTP